MKEGRDGGGNKRKEGRKFGGSEEGRKGGRKEGKE